MWLSPGRARSQRSPTRRLDDDEKGLSTVDTLGGAQVVSIISEAGPVLADSVRVPVQRARQRLPAKGTYLVSTLLVVIQGSGKGGAAVQRPLTHGAHWERSDRWGQTRMFEKHKAVAADLERQQRIERTAYVASQAHDALEAARLRQTTHVDGIVLKKDEAAYLSVQSAHLVEPRHAPGQWAGGSHGVSLHIAKGVNYRVGASRGTYIQGAERPTVIDTGLFAVTNQRCLFVGSKRTTEWLYTKLVGFSLAEGTGGALFNVSNRQKSSGVQYTHTAQHVCDTVIAAAIAQFQGPAEHAALVNELEAEYRSAWQQWQTALQTAMPAG